MAELNDMVPLTKAQVVQKRIEELMNIGDSYDFATIARVCELLFEDILEGHNCCDTQTWQFNDALYHQVLRAT